MAAASLVAGAAAVLALRVLRPETRSVEVVRLGRNAYSILLRRLADAPELAKDVDPSTLLREPVPPDTVRTLLALEGQRGTVLDPKMYYRPRGPSSRRKVWPEHPVGEWKIELNSLGMREAQEPAREKPAWRVLVTGDSHTAGVCQTRESFANVLEQELREEEGDSTIEVLNAGVGGYMLYNYIGVLESYVESLDPDVFVAVIYGGNDFAESMTLQRYFHRRGAPRQKPYDMGTLAGRARDSTARGRGAQEVLQAIYFANNPDDVGVIEATAFGACAEIARIAAASDVAVVIAYLPPPSRAQPELYAAELEELVTDFGTNPSVLDVSDRIADGLVARLAAAGIEHVDLRPAFRAATEPLYWRSDLHINVTGHRLVAEQLHEHVRVERGR